MKRKDWAELMNCDAATEASAQPITDALELGWPFSNVDTRYWILIIYINQSLDTGCLQEEVWPWTIAVFGWQQFLIGSQARAFNCQYLGEAGGVSSLVLKDVWVVLHSIHYVGLVIFLCQISCDIKQDHVCWKHLA